jgi:type IV secretion system protein VirD4
MRNYAGHRLSPWLGHLMVSRQETSRPLLTPGEVMQLPPADELVLVSGSPPIRANKARYYQDRRLLQRILPPPDPAAAPNAADSSDAPPPAPVGDWVGAIVAPPPVEEECDNANAGIRREPELPAHEEIVPERDGSAREFELAEDEPDDEAQRLSVLQRRTRTIARQAALDPADDMGL